MNSWRWEHPRFSFQICCVFLGGNCKLGRQAESSSTHLLPCTKYEIKCHEVIDSESYRHRDRGRSSNESESTHGWLDDGSMGKADGMACVYPDPACLSCLSLLSVFPVARTRSISRVMASSTCHLSLSRPLSFHFILQWPQWKPCKSSSLFSFFVRSFCVLKEFTFN